MRDGRPVSTLNTNTIREETALTVLVIIVVCLIVCYGISRGYPPSFATRMQLLGIQLTLLGIFFLLCRWMEKAEVFAYLAFAAVLFGTLLTILFTFKEK
jgi:membrane-associated HD superfamily phosphohydrolase